MESVKLPFPTTPITPELFENVEVRWWDRNYKKVHVYQNGSDQPVEQDPLYRSRTRINEDMLRTGDLSLTLRHPTLRDGGEFRCDVRKDGESLRRKIIQLKVTGKVHVQPEDINARLL